MSTDAIESLLEKLSSGDEAAAQEVFRAYEPYLRAVVRRMLPVQLRAKFDSIDVVQSIWADVLVGFRQSAWQFASAAQLRAFLVKVTRNRFIDRYRQNRSAVDRQQSLEQTSPQELKHSRNDLPTGQAEGDELWEQMMALCPPRHHAILQLKRDGHTLAEIAERTGLHPSSIRRILYDLARQLAANS